MKSGPKTKEEAIRQIEAEAVRVGMCLVHHSYKMIRKIYELKHGPVGTSEVCRTCSNAGCILDAHHTVRGHHSSRLLSDYESKAKWVNGCWIYPLKTTTTGTKARIVYQLRHGTIGDSKILVCHTCDNPACINDAHHFLGTHKDNLQDASKKGRLNKGPLSAARRAQISKSKKAWAKNPENREAMRESARIAWATGKFSTRKSASEAMLINWDVPKFRKKMLKVFAKRKS